MEQPIKILIVEDEMIIAANISLELTKLGYEVTGIVSRGEEVMVHLKEESPDLLLMDINLKGKMNGVETVIMLQKTYDIPVIYLTANADEAHFNMAKITKPSAFISKPFKKLDLQRAIELAVVNLKEKVMTEELEVSDAPYILSDAIFVKHHEKMVKVIIEQILYIEAERNYCRIHSKGKEYLLVMTLKDLNEKLPGEHFLRIHRSFIINIAQIEEVAGTHVVIGRKAIPISKSMRSDLLKRLQTI